jgi:hypothetical protein
VVSKSTLTEGRVRSSNRSRRSRVERIVRAAERGSFRRVPRNFAFMFFSQLVSEGDMESLLM